MEDTETPQFPPTLLHGWKSGLGVGFSSADEFTARPSAAASSLAVFGLDMDQTCKGGRSGAAKPGSALKAALPTSPPWPEGHPHGIVVLCLSPIHNRSTQPPLPGTNQGSLASLLLNADSKAHFLAGQKNLVNKPQLPLDKPKTSRISQKPVQGMFW